MTHDGPKVPMTEKEQDARLESLLDEYSTADGLDPARRDRILAQIESLGKVGKGPGCPSVFACIRRFDNHHGIGVDCQEYVAQRFCLHTAYTSLLHAGVPDFLAPGLFDDNAGKPDRLVQRDLRSADLCADSCAVRAAQIADRRTLGGPGGR